jgi:peptidoglycan/LPS O-acetylase OafA/YrhL
MAVSTVRRIRSLDGLRGIAAAIVVFHPLVLATVAPLAAQYYPHAPNLHGAAWAFTFTPLHLFWAGPECVIVFFVLSGYVLSLAAAKGARFVAASYYPSRFVRLYVPVWGALGFAALAHVVVTHHMVSGATIWLNHHSVDFQAREVVKDVVLVFGAGDGTFTTVLWSLQWEVIFSLLLPVYLLVGRLPKRSLVGLVALLVMCVGGIHDDYTHYLPPFMLGVLAAYERSRIVELIDRRRAWWLLAASSVCLTATWWLPSGVGQRIGLGLTGAAALGLVVCGITRGEFAHLLESRPLQVLGRRSFSLYLVHEPVLVAMAFALGGKPALLLLAVTALPVIALGTEAFYRLVERPSHALARLASRSSG